MFEYDEEAKKVDFSHNPFSMPQGELEALETKDPLDILAYQYDIVCNGVELSLRRDPEPPPGHHVQGVRDRRLQPEEVDTNFSGMINAFKFGAPPHGGSAPGIDRIVMLLAGEPNIREVVLFPMNQKAEDLMMNAPAKSAPSSCAKQGPARFQVWPIAAPTAGGEGPPLPLALLDRCPGRARSRSSTAAGTAACSSSGSRASPPRPSGAAAMTRSTSSKRSRLTTARSSSSSSSTSRRRRRTSGCKARLEHPWKRWKVTAEDFRNRARRVRLSRREPCQEMLAHTGARRWAPWHVIDGNNKKNAARIATPAKAR
jgi:hypothetical protein